MGDVVRATREIVGAMNGGSGAAKVGDAWRGIGGDYDEGRDK